MGLLYWERVDLLATPYAFICCNCRGIFFFVGSLEIGKVLLPLGLRCLGLAQIGSSSSSFSKSEIELIINSLNLGLGLHTLLESIAYEELGKQFF